MSGSLALSLLTAAPFVNVHCSPLSGSFPAASGGVLMTLKSSRSVPLSPSTTVNRSKIRTRIRCDVAVKPTASVEADASSSPSSEEEERAKAVGARVRVKVPLEVYHVVRVPKVELTGTEGVIRDYVAVWKGKRISANLPYKVEFVKEIEGRGLVKFFAHLREDEFEYVK